MKVRAVAREAPVVSLVAIASRSWPERLRHRVVRITLHSATRLHVRAAPPAGSPACPDGACRLPPSRRTRGWHSPPRASPRAVPAVTQPSSVYAPRADAPAAAPNARFPLGEAEELLASLPGVISVRILESDGGGVGDVHVLTAADVAPKQTVRNVESALLAQFGWRMDHRKISVATTNDAGRARAARPSQGPALVPPTARVLDSVRRVYFEDVEVRRSSRALWCRVLLRKGAEIVSAEAEAPPAERARVEELAARAAVTALVRAEGDTMDLALEGAEVVTAFGREFVFVGVAARQGRGATLLTGSCEVRDGHEAAAVLAVLDATNRWIARGR